jgi:hypothetical protein
METTRRQILLAAAFVCALAFATTGAYAQVIDTRIGKIETINGAQCEVKRYGMWKKVFCEQRTGVPDRRPSTACFLSFDVYTRCVDS